MQMRKDEFRTDDEKDAWQQGYVSSIEVLTNLHQDATVGCMPWNRSPISYDGFGKGAGPRGYGRKP